MEYVLTGAFLIFFVVFMFGGIVRAQMRAEVEQGKTPLYKETAGGAVGPSRYRGPFVSVRMYDEFMVVADWNPLILRYDQIDRIEVTKPFIRIRQGVQIFHHQPGAPELVYLAVGNPAHVKQLIEARVASPPHNATV